jgi:hypothetical protein
MLVIFLKGFQITYFKMKALNNHVSRFYFLSNTVLCVEKILIVFPSTWRWHTSRPPFCVIHCSGRDGCLFGQAHRREGYEKGWWEWIGLLSFFHARMASGDGGSRLIDWVHRFYTVANTWQDAHIADCGTIFPNVNFFGVLDGHGGSTVSKQRCLFFPPALDSLYSAVQLVPFVVDQLKEATHAEEV